MNSIYSNEGQVVSDQWLPNCENLLIADFDFGERPGPAESIEFADDFEQEFARRLDERGIAWQYKPRTFAVEWDEDGNFIDSFTPSFFLPASDLYLELVAPDGRVFIEKVRKASLLRQQYPTTTIEVVHAERACAFE